MSELNEVTISQAIIEAYQKKLINHLDIDIAIVGGGPSGLTAAYFLAKEGKKVALLERKLSLGGGVWGGGMMYNQIVVQEKGLHILEEFDIRYTTYQAGYYIADSIETASTLCSYATKAGAAIFNLISAEDIIIREEKIVGLVLNWSPVMTTGLHVDPMAIRAQFIVDSTGHNAEIIQIIQKKMPGKLKTHTGNIMGEKPMWAEIAETEVVKNTQMVYPGVYVTGMAANATFGSHRMGPIFGGMLLSGKKVADLILEKI
ncbi:MAG: sulfide-dependent adenosine diphosphate thiazole synthase [bacterium]